MRRLLLLPLLLTFAACDSADSDGALEGLYVGTAVLQAEPGSGNGDATFTYGLDITTDGGTFTLGPESYALLEGNGDRAEGPLTGTGTFDPPSVTVALDAAVLVLNGEFDLPFEGGTETGTAAADGSSITLTFDDGEGGRPVVFRRQ